MDVFSFDDIDSLTIEEIEWIEDATNTPIDQLFAANAKKGPMLRAMALIKGRRSDPDFSAEDAGKVEVSFAGSTEAPKEQGHSPD